MKCESCGFLSCPDEKLSGWKDFFLYAALALLVLRLTIWKFFPHTEIFVREELSNLLVAGLSCLLFIGYQVFKLVTGEATRHSGFFSPVLFLSFAAGLSVLCSADRSASIVSVVIFISALFFFFVLCDLLDTPRRVSLFVSGMLVCAFVVALFAVREFVLLSLRQPLSSDVLLRDSNSSLHYLLTHRRAVSLLGWPNSLAGYLLLFLPLAGVYTARAKSFSWRVVWGGVSIVMLAGFLATFSLLGWSSLFLSAVFMIPLVLRRVKVSFSFAQIGGFVLFGILLLGAFAWVVARKDFSGALQPRLLYYQNAAALIAEHPFRGCGFGAFGMASRHLVASQEAFTTFVHNTYLQWLVETGVFGLIGVTALLAAFIGACRRAMARFSEGGAGWLVVGLVWGLLAFLIDNFFSFTFIKANIAWHGWAVMAGLAALGRPVSGVFGLQALRKRCAVLAVIFSGFVLFVIAGLSFSFFLYIEGKAAHARGELNQAGRLFVRASRINPWSCVYPAAAGVVFANSWRESGRAELLAASAASFEEAVRRSPLDYVNYFSLGQIYAVMGQTDKSREFFREARRRSPFEFEREARRTREVSAPAR